jgi:hypothetical protein
MITPGLSGPQLSKRGENFAYEDVSNTQSYDQDRHGQRSPPYEA